MKQPYNEGVVDGILIDSGLAWRVQLVKLCRSTICRLIFGGRCIWI